MILRTKPHPRRISGFTLIELLIVIAIILILIAIALPNFLAARTRAVIAQARGEVRTLGIALEFYATDYNGKYPPLSELPGRNTNDNRNGIHDCIALTTPVSYVNGEVIKAGDPFTKGTAHDARGRLADPNGGFSGEHYYSYGYVNIDLYREGQTRADRLPRPGGPHFAVLSLGPDHVKGPNPDGGGWAYNRYARNPPPPYYDVRFKAWGYSPTNGLRSNGDLTYFN